MEAERTKWLSRTSVVRDDSKVYREKAKEHEYGYTLNGDAKTGTVNKAELDTAEKRKAHGEKMIATDGVHAGMLLLDLVSLVLPNFVFQITSTSFNRSSTISKIRTT